MLAVQMSARGPRVCLVCRGATAAAHLGMDLCRACSVFYKNAAKSMPHNNYLCLHLPVKKYGLQKTCRACRFDLIEKLIKESTDTPSPQEDSVECKREEEDDFADQICSSVESVENEFQSVLSSDNSLLDRLRVNYRSMSYTRMSAELHAGEYPPHPLEFDLGNPPLYPTTYCALNRGNRVLLSSALEFASATFKRFDNLSRLMKWKLMLNFFYRFRYFEGCIRANKYCPTILIGFTLLSYTTWLSMDDLEYFFSDCPHGDVDGAVKYMSNRTVQGITACREIIARLSPTDDEFLLVVALFFWSVDGITDCEQKVVELAGYYRKEIHKEMHAYYRDDLGLDDYASRMGELVFYVMVFDVSEHVKQHYEMFRLLGLFKDDSFMYQ